MASHPASPQTPAVEALPRSPSPPLPPQQAPEELPPLIAIAPAIFLPVNEDLTKPIPPIPTSTSARLLTSIEQHTAHSRAVSANIVNYYRREVFRLSQLPADAAPTQAAPYETLIKSDRDALLANLEAPHEPGRDYNIRQDQIPATDLSLLPTPAMRTLGQATEKLAMYHEHAGVKGQKLRAELKLAEEREAA